MTARRNAALLVSVVSFVLPLAPATAHAQTTVVLLPPSGSNIHPGILRAASEVLRDHLQRTEKFTVVSAGGEPTADEPASGRAAEQARAAQADMAVVLRITRLANVARVRLSAYRSADAHLVHWDSMSTGGTPDDLDPVLARLAKGLATGRPVRETADIETVTQKERETLTKREANKTFGVRVGSLFALDRAGGDNIGSVPGLGLFWLYDARTWLADVGLDFGSTDGNSMLTVGVGAYYPFKREDVAPYLGGSVRYAHMNLGGRGASGLTLQPTFGLLLGRLSSVQIRGEVGYFLNTFAEEEPAPASPATAGSPVIEHFSHGPTLSVGIGF